MMLDEDEGDDEVVEAMDVVRIRVVLEWYEAAGDCEPDGSCVWGRST